MKTILLAALVALPALADLQYYEITTFPSRWQQPSNCLSSSPCPPNVLLVSPIDEVAFFSNTRLLVSFYDGIDLLAAVETTLQPFFGQGVGQVVFYASDTTSNWSSYDSALISFQPLVSGCAGCTVRFTLLSGRVIGFGSRFSLGVDDGAGGIWATAPSWMEPKEVFPNIPEPSSWIMTATGAGILLACRRRLQARKRPSPCEEGEGAMQEESR